MGVALAGGNTRHINDGKPTPTEMAETLCNLGEVAPTIYFNVPTGINLEETRALVFPIRALCAN